MTKQTLYAGGFDRIRSAGQVRHEALRRLVRAPRVLCILLLLGADGVAATLFQPLPPCAACIAVVITPGQAVLLPERLGGIDVLVRVLPGGERLASAALERIDERDGRPGLLIEGLPTGPLDAGTLAPARVLVFAPGGQTSDSDRVAYALKAQVTAARGAAERDIQIGVAASPSLMIALLRRDIGAYVDFTAWLGDPPASAASGRVVWRTSAQETPVLTSAATAIAATRTAAAERWFWRLPDDVVEADRVLRDLTAAARLLRIGLIPTATIAARCDERPAETFLDPHTLETIAFLPGCAAPSAVAITPPAVPLERVGLSTGDALLRFAPASAGDRFAEGVDVVAARRLSVEEIVARHQSAVARQAAAVRSVISKGTLTITFEAPGFPAPVAITSDTILYSGGGRTELEQQSIRVNGVEFQGGGVPRLPILEPERAASPPLAITLTNLYRYGLAGEETIAGVRCYVVTFEPADDRVPLFRGRAWIAADSFAMVRVAAVQTALSGPIVSSEQIEDFRMERAGVWLLGRAEVRQLYEGAAHRTPIHRVLSIARHEVNAADFGARRTAAYASNHVMLRDTPEGYRYLRRSHTEGSVATVEPVTAGRVTSVRTVIGGVIVDPNITQPLPFAGLSYVDFDLLGTGTQLNAFFGGTYGQLAFSIPSLGRSRWQLAGRAFGIASSYNDRSFIHGRERYEENVRQRPAQLAVWLLRPLTSRITVRAGYDLDYTHLARADGTASDFVVPAAQLVHGARAAIDAQRGGWTLSLWWNPAWRQGWRRWGPAGGHDYDPRERDFQRYGASASRSVVVTPRLIARVEAAWMAGRDLDRFSRYSFGTFDNRLRGYPSALIRYDRGAVMRSAVAWSAGRFLRIDGFFDTAVVHDPGFGSGLRNYTGLGAGLEAPAPFGTLVGVEWGYGMRGVNADGSRGTHVMRVSAFKIF